VCVGPFYKSGRHHNSAQFLFCTFQLSLLRACFLASLTALTRRIGVPAQAMERRRQALPFLTRWRFQWHGGDVKFQSSHGTDVETKASWEVREVNGTHCPLRFWDPKSFQCVTFKAKRRNDGLLKGITGSQYIIMDHTWSHLPKPNSGHVARWVSLKVRCTVQGISRILQIRAIPP